MNDLYKYLVCWSFIGYIFFIGFCVWHFKYKRRQLKSSFYWLIIFLSGPAVSTTVIMITIIDYLIYGYRDKN